MAGVSDILPAAIGVAASPLPVISAILLVFTPRARATSTSFVAGWFAGVGIVTTVFVLLAEIIEAGGYPPTWVSWTRIVLGAILVVLGARQWITRGQRTAEPAWMRGLAQATPGSALRLGVLLTVANPKSLAFAAAGGLSIGAAEQSTAAEVASVVVFAAVASISALMPVALFLLAGDSVLGPLGKAKEWLTAHNAAVIAVVVVVIGFVLVAKGLSGLR